MKTPQILVVEDNSDNLDLVRFLLERAGYSVLAAENGTVGWEVAQRELPDLILLDLSIPEIDGWELTRRLKADPALHHIRVVALTGHTLPGDRARAFEVGCDGYITKPLDVMEFAREVASYLPA